MMLGICLPHPHQVAFSLYKVSSKMIEEEGMIPTYDNVGIGQEDTSWGWGRQAGVIYMRISR